jgi:RNA polymerase sigma-70 factor (ECF subfamily)
MQTAFAQIADVEIVRLIAGGDEDAFALLYDRHCRIIFGLLMKILQNQADAEEVLQDVFLGVWKRAAEFDEQRGSVLALLIVLARSRAIDRLRANATRRRTIEYYAVIPSNRASNSPLDNLLRTESRQFIQTGLDELSEKSRNALLMSLFEGFTQSEIATQTGTPLGTIKTQMRTGTMKLRKTLKPAVS